MAMADGNERGHGYPTRWTLRRHASRSLSLLEDEAKNPVLVACKRRKEESRPTFSRLPREIIFNILLFIPAAFLHEVVRYVCKQWYDVVRDPLFVKAHYQMSSSGFLIQEPFQGQAHYIDIDADATRFKVTHFDLPSPADILGSFNGLVLLYDFITPQVHRVMNLVTKQIFSLPPLVLFDTYYQNACFALTSVGHYKVVHVGAEACPHHVQMRVFTIGVDKAWRLIDLQAEGIPMNKRVKIILVTRPLFIAGFLYWHDTFHYSGGFAMNVDSETIYQFPEPEKGVCLDRRQSSFIILGTCLGLLQHQTGRLWKLTDVKSGKWTEMALLNMNVVFCKVDKMFYPSECLVFIPVCLINGVLWFYRRVGEEFIVVRYNLTNGKCLFFPIKRICERTLVHPHVQTLLSPKNCYP